MTMTAAEAWRGRERKGRGKTSNQIGWAAILVRCAFFYRAAIVYSMDGETAPPPFLPTYSLLAA